MKHRFGNKQLSFRFQAQPDLSKKYPGIGNFVYHPEGENEIDRGLNSKVVGFTSVDTDSICNPFIFSALLQCVQHLRLHIGSNDTTLIADKLGEADGKISHPASNIQNRHPHCCIGAEHFLGVVNEAPQRVVK